MALVGLLKNREFAKLWSAQLVSLFGNGVTDILIVYLVTKLTHNPMIIGFVIFASLMPTAFLGLFTGPFADRFSRRNLMVIADLWRALLVVAMIFWQDSAAALIFLVMLHGIGTALFTPARSSAIPDVVGEEHVTEAVSVSQSTMAAMGIAGPAIGGLLLIIHMPTVNFIIDAATFVISAVLIFSIKGLGKAQNSKAVEGETFFESIKLGIKQVMGLSALKFLLVSLIPIVFVTGILNTNLAAVLLLTFHVPAVHFGFLEGLFGFGAIVGSVLAPKVLKKVRPAYMLLTSIALIGVWMVLLIPLDPIEKAVGLPSVYIWSGVMGVLNALINVPLSALFIKITPAGFRGRGAALLQALTSASMMAGILFGGWLAARTTVLDAMASAGGLLIILGLFLPLLKGFHALKQPDPAAREASASLEE